MLKESKSGKRKILLRVTVFIVVIALLNVGTALSVTAATKKRPAAEFVEYVKMVYEQKWKYVWGGETAGTVDCSGMIYYFAGGPRTSWNMIESDAEKGEISTMPDIPGIILWRPGHVGVYIGGGIQIDARNSTYNVVMDSVYKNGKTSWTHWIKHPNIDYSGYSDTPTPSSSVPAAAESKAAPPSESKAVQPEESAATSLVPEYSIAENSTLAPENSMAESAYTPESVPGEVILEFNTRSKPPLEENSTPLPETSKPTEQKPTEQIEIHNPGIADIEIPDTVYSFKSFDEYFRMYDISRRLEMLPVEEWAVDIGEEEYYAQKEFNNKDTQERENTVHHPEIFIV